MTYIFVAWPLTGFTWLLFGVRAPAGGPPAVAAVDGPGAG